MASRVDVNNAWPLSDLGAALRAVVAADRHATSEALEGNDQLLHRRLTVFYG